MKDETELKETGKTDITALMVIFMSVKFIVYYYLIEWTTFSLCYTLISISITLGLYYSIAKSKLKHKIALFNLIYVGFSIFMFADVMYFNYYNQTVSVQQFWQLGNVAKVPESFVATLIPLSIFIVIDIPVVIYQFRNFAKYKIAEETIKAKGKTVRIVAAIVFIFIVAVNPFKSAGLARITGEEFFINHINDIVVNTVGKIVDTDMEEKEVLKIIDANREQNVSEELKGVAAGRNLIIIQLEAFQNCMIGASYNGVELTPNLNKLIKNDSLYFDNFYTNIGKGNTADAEFTVLNSLYPSTERECYTLYESNNFRGLPWILKKEGYKTMAFHGYEGSFWNRETAYPYQGIDSFYSMEKLEQDDLIGLGISDKSVFRQAADIIDNTEGNYFSFIISLTNHHPYNMDESLWTVPVKEEDEGSKFASYLQTVKYTDEAVGEFIADLQARGLYEDSIIVMYGDHHGLNKDMDDNDFYMERFLGKPYDYDEMFKVPLIINIPSLGFSETISTVGGQIDVLPTICNLMELELDKQYICGQDIVNATEGFVAFSAYINDGSFVTDNVMYEMSREGIYENGRAWNTETGKKVNLNSCEDYYKKGVAVKEASRQLLRQNLIPPLK